MDNNTPTPTPKEALSWEEAFDEIEKRHVLKWRNLSDSAKAERAGKAALLFRSSLEEELNDVREALKAKSLEAAKVVSKLDAEKIELKEETTLLRERLKLADLVIKLGEEVIYSVDGHDWEIDFVKRGEHQNAIEKYQSLKPKDDEQRDEK